MTDSSNATRDRAANAAREALGMAKSPPVSTDDEDATRDRAAIPAEHLCLWCNVRRKMSDSSATCGMLRCVLRMRRAEEQDRV